MYRATEFILAITFLLSLILTFYYMPGLINKLRAKNIVVRDYYKKGKIYVPTNGGIAVLFVCLFMLTIFPVAFFIVGKLIVRMNLSAVFYLPPYLAEINTAMVLVVATYGVFGILDDYVKIRRLKKILIPYIFASPLMLLSFTYYDNVVVLPIIGEFCLGTSSIFGIKVGIIFRYVVIPLYILVCANLANMHSGFNGLASGTSMIVLFFLVVKSIIIVGKPGNIVATSAILGGIAAFWLYNRYPSKILEGNVGATTFGAAIGVTIIAQGFFIAGFVMLIPHTANFLLYVYWLVMRKLHPDIDKYKKAKYGTIRDDGTLEVPNPYTLKWVLPYYRRVTERQAVRAMYALTTIFCVIGLLIPF